MTVQASRRLPTLKVSPQALAEIQADQAIKDFQSETAEIVEAPDPLKARLVIHLLAAMVVIAILLASVIKVDRVVSGNGRVVSDMPNLVVQPLETSVVRSLLVRAGQVVHKGETLATLDPTFTTADLGSLKAQSARLKATIARLEAEQKGQPYSQIETDPESVLQYSIWRSRQAEYTAQMVSYKQKIDGYEATITRAKQDVDHYKSRLGLNQQVEDMRKDLEKLQVGSKLNSLLATDSRVEIQRNLSQAQNDIATATHEMEAQRADRDVYNEHWKSDLTKQLVDSQNELDKTNNDLAKAQRRDELVSLRAEEDSVVLELGDFSVGSVVQPGQKLLTLVPIGSGLSIETDIDAIDQGFVVPDQTANLKFAAYRYVDHGVGHGKVRSISPDSFAAKEDGTKMDTPNRFYRAMIDVTDLPLRGVPKDFALVPGMTLTTDIVVGRRTIMGYILEGTMHTFSEGFREP
jgi:HlyD family type I secretion membrane fusion protein